MFFFIYMTVYLNEQLMAMKVTEGLEYMLDIPGAALMIFTIFFISYAQQIFTKRRRSEFGIFMILGMTKRDISRLILIENSAIALLALVIGLASGMLISKFLFELLLKSVDIHEIAFHINSQMIVYSIFAFVLVFIVTVGQSLYVTRKKKIIENVKAEKVTENTAQHHPMVGAFGVACVIGSIVGLYVTYTNPDGGEYLLLWAMGTFLGLYIALSHLTTFLISLLKKNKHFYYRKLLYLTNMDYKYKQFTTIMTIVTVMIMITLLYSTLVFSTYQMTEKEAIQATPYDIGFISTDDKNNIPPEEVHAILDKHDHPVLEYFSIPVYMHFQKDYDNFTHTVTFMPLSAFNAFTNSTFELETNELIYHLNHDISGELIGISYGQPLRFLINGNEVNYDYDQIIAEKHFNYLGELFIITEEELETLQKNVDGLYAEAHFINVENWAESEEAVLALGEAFDEFNSGTPTLHVENILPEEELFYIDSRVDGYARHMSSNGISFFVAIFLSILFFIGSFLLLYIQLFSEVDQEKQRIRNLYRIGMTRKEVKKIISQEITTIFMLPTLLGGSIALLYLIAMAKDVGGVIANPEFLFSFFMITGIYLVIQIVFLFYAKRKMVGEVAGFG